MPDLFGWCPPYDPVRAARRRAWVAYYTTRGVSLSRVGDLAARKATTGQLPPQ